MDSVNRKPARSNSGLWRVCPAAAKQRREKPRIGLALGGGFARGIAHAGVLKVLERYGIPLHCVTGVSAGAVVAAMCASGMNADEIARTGCSMRFGDVGGFSLGQLGLLGNGRMNRFLERTVRTDRFEQMRTSLGVVATDLCSGQPVSFSGHGGVFAPVRASCAYPGLFQPVKHEDRLLVDGAISMPVGAALARHLGATHVVSVALPSTSSSEPPSNLMQVLSRCFQILGSRAEDSWRKESDLVITPDVSGMEWHAFERGPELVAAGEAAASACISRIQEWLAVPVGRTLEEAVAS